MGFDFFVMIFEDLDIGLDFFFFFFFFCRLGIRRGIEILYC